MRRDDIVDDVIESSDIKWKQVFDHLHIELFAYENAFLEFKKAFHKHNFDYLWHCEMQKTEIEYYAVMGALWYLYKAGASQDDNVRDDASTKESLQDPFSLPTNPVDYNYDIELPLMKNLSNEMMLILNTNFRVNFHKNQSELELKIQKLLDATRSKLRSNIVTGILNASFNNPTGTSQSQSGANT